MDITEVVNLFVNNSVAIAIIIYFCVRDYKFMNTLVITLQTLVDICNELKGREEKNNGNS